MKKLIFAMVLILMFATVAVAGDKPAAKTYYQTTPSQTLPAGSIWNQIVTEKADGTVSKSYFKYGPNNQVLKPGGLWNNLITEDKGKIKK